MNKKIINNAISAYFWLWLLLLLPSKKENLNHTFVKKHAFTALIIHILMFLNYLIFISFSLFSGIFILWFSLNHIIASIIFILLFWLLLYGVSKANSWSDFSINDMSNMTKVNKIIEIKSSNLNEAWILTIILSLIPFIWFYIKAKFSSYKSVIIENNTKLNLIITLVICLFFSFWYENLWLLFWLFYLIFIWFYSILLITKQSLLSLNLSKIPTFNEIYIYFLSIINYLKNYFSGKKFVWIKEILKIKQNEIEKTFQENKEKLEKLKDSKINIFLSYIPYLNLICLFQINSKNKFHIINGLIITILSIILVVLKYNNFQIFLVFLIFFGIWYSKKIEYKFPFLFDIYEMCAFIFSKIFFIWKKAVKMQKEEKEVIFKVEE